MKRGFLLGICLFLAGSLATRLPIRECLPAWAIGAPTVDGDVNGDGALNLTDPVHLLGFLFQGGPPPVPCRAATQPITVAVLVRHAEKGTDPANPDDPPLTPEGAARAQRLAEVFKNAAVDNLIASEKKRTQETLQPLATLKAIASMDKLGDEGAVEQSSTLVADRIKSIASAKPGSVVVVAHHSTTLKEILEKLGIPAADTAGISTGVFDNLLIILLPAGQAPQLLTLRYL